MALEVLREWGSCGRVVLVDGRVAGHAIYVPAAFVPGQAALPDRAGLAGRRRC